MAARELFRAAHDVQDEHGGEHDEGDENSDSGFK
jgi:hypothetical protein